VSNPDSRTWPALDVSGLLRGGRDDDPDALERLHATLGGFAVTAIDERTPDLWRIYFHDEVERDRATVALRVDHPGLSARPVDVPDEDWAARSQADLRAVRVGAIVVAPPWDVPADPGEDVRVIRIQPSMGFGTGHHPTTRLCLAALQRLDVAGQTVLDVGCGSAVLAIAASLRGAAPVMAFDDDPDAVQAARANLELNPGARVDLQVAPLGGRAFRPADLVFANLTGGLLVSAAADLRRLVVAGGHLVLSGLLTEEEPAVRTAFPGLALDHRDEEAGWVGLTLRAD
jgi:ribosomal protein L11 methyltransferase